MTDSNSPRDPSVPPTDPADPVEPAVPAEGKPAEPPPKKRRRWGRRLLVAAGVILLLLVLFVALIPTLISTGPGNRLAANIAERFVDGDVRIDGLRVGWMSGTAVNNLVIDDPQTGRVLDVADFRSGLTLLQAIRGNYDLGDTSFRAQLPLIAVYPDDTTNLDRVFRLDEPSEPTEFDPADLRGSVKGDVEATIQRVDAEGKALHDSPRVDVTLSGLEAIFADGKSVRHAIPVQLAVAGEPAGTVTASGEVGWPTEERAVPPVSEKLTIEAVDLEAIETVLAAFAGSDLDLAGILDGEFDIDTSSGMVAGDLAGQGVNVQPRDGTGYTAETLELTLQGSFDLPDAGAELATPKFATVETLRLVATSDQGKDELTFAGVVDLEAMQEDPVANWSTLARDVSLAIVTPFARAEGSGESLGTFALTGNADMAAMQARFGDLLPAEEAAGTINFEFVTEPASSEEAITARWTVNGDQLRYLPVRPEQDAMAEAEAEAEVRPTSFDVVTLEGNAVLLPASEDQQQVISSAAMTLAASNAGQPLVTGSFTATDMNADGSIGEARLDALVIYAGLRTALGSLAELPEPEGEVPPIRVTAALDLDEETRTFRLSEPLLVTVDGQTMATVEMALREAEVTEDSTTWEAQTLSANVSLAVADLVLAPLGMLGNPAQRMAGELVVALADGESLTVDSSDPAGSASGHLAVRLAQAQAAGFTIDGAIPVELASGVAAISSEAEPLEANGGFIRLAGTSFDLGQNSLTAPEGEVLENVALNPVMSDVLGQYINFVFVNPEQANGFLNLEVTAAGPLNLSDPFGAEGGDVTIAFGIRDLYIKNDIIGALAEAGMDEVAGALPPSLTQLPGVGASLLERFDISEEVKEEISSFRGNLADGRVRLVNGVAQSTVTFNIADPRRGAETEGELYGVTFGGDVHLETLAADLNVTVPRELIEKWAGENPDELVRVFGEQPFQKLIPQGVTLGVEGTSRVPRVDVSDVTENMIPRAVDAAIKGGVQNRLEDELRKRIPGVFQ